jgi:hypothetical protein
MTRVSRKEARILKQRSLEMRGKGGGLSLAEVERRMRASMANELHRMARRYDGSPKRAKELLDAILVAEQEGLPPGPVRGDPARGLRIAADARGLSPERRVRSGGGFLPNQVPGGRWGCSWIHLRNLIRQESTRNGAG